MSMITAMAEGKGEQVDKAKANMKAMGMSEGMMMRCRVMMQTHLDAYDPSALLVLKDELKLTPQQVSTLKGVAERARLDAKAALTEDQLDKVAPMLSEDAPKSMIEMHRHMMPKMHMSGGRGKDNEPGDHHGRHHRGEHR